ncbi:hypothetical protein J2X61_005875 [Bacillus sp. 3255]|nr:hypothetical protein [Bacillus sp. 3255]
MSTVEETIRIREINKNNHCYWYLLFVNEKQKTVYSLSKVIHSFYFYRTDEPIGGVKIAKYYNCNLY